MAQFSKGFTLIELLIVIGILVVLVAASLIAINPFRQFAQANDANRQAGITSLINAVYQNVIDNRGAFACATAIPTVATVMGSATTSGQYNICSCIVPNYMGALPFDPQTGSYTSCTTYNTAYTILRDATTGRITIAAPAAQLSTISITR
ncbi:MAG: Uncharacterized protein G01um101430_500 [Parcubacteria group bacterium Gr01-1014_30]|nr:MAG: Uncharacterized protein G01um101430_500 [Parcubacteria group bacterium Gr01-1014_30]